MAHILKKEIRELLKQKTKIQAKGNLLEEAKICNALGDLYSKSGQIDKAIAEHRTELRLCESLSLPIDIAVAHRKLGECLCESSAYADALRHQRLHLKIAQEQDDLKEQQRAFATIGRTYFVWSQDGDSEKVLDAKRAYLDSWDLCGRLVGEVTDKELIEMKARLYLNLGLVFDAMENVKRAKQFVKRALSIAQERGLNETERLAQLSLGGLHLQGREPSQSLRCYEEALKIVRREKDVVAEAELFEAMGQSYLVLGDLSAARDCFRRSYKIDLAPNRVMLLRTLKIVCKAVKLERELNATDAVGRELMARWDRLGDLCSKVKAYKKAIESYQKELDVGKRLGLEEGDLTSIYVSLAMTYDDDGQYEKALDFAMRELKALAEENLLGAADSWCFIGRIRAEARRSKESVCGAYEEALECAKRATSVRKQVKVLTHWKDVCTDRGYDNELNKIEEILSDLEPLDEGDDETEENSEARAAYDDNVSDTSDLEFSESDVSDEELTATPGNRRKRVNATKIHKVNQKGETMLQQACIAGNSKEVQRLLSQGASVITRDYCGWTPLHEACNHGYEEIAKLLLDYGADVNDRGGQHCNGMTPLHDAAVNGHCDVVRLLVDRGANVFEKDGDGQTPLDVLLSALDNDDDVDESQDSELNQGHREVVSYLRHIMTGRRDDQGLSRRRNASFGFGYDDDDDDHGGGGGDEEVEDRLSILSSPPASPPALISEHDDMDVDDSLPSDGETSSHRRRVNKSRSRLIDDEDDDTWNRGTRRRRREAPSALIAENGDDDWLVDDISPVAKRRKSDKKRQTSAEKAETIVEHTANAISEPAGPTNRIPTGISPMRVRVTVLGKTFVIPCPSVLKDGSSSTIGWLATQAADRYYELCGLKPRLRIVTKEEAMFSTEDEIGFVLGNNEELEGKVENWNLPPLKERYLTACRTTGQDSFLSANALLPLFRSLQRQTSLTAIELSGNEIDDVGMEQLALAMTTLPNVVRLNLALNRFTMDGVRRFVEVVRRRDDATSSDLGGQPFGRLSSFDISYNELDDSLASCLGDLFLHCPCLVELKLVSCGLTSAFASPRSAIQVARLRHLSVAHNRLGSAGLKAILQLVDCSCLQSLDLSATRLHDSAFASPERIGRILADAYANLEEQKVQYLNLSDCGLVDLDIERLMSLLRGCSDCLKTLDLSCNQLRHQSIEIFSRWLTNAKALERLDLSCNPCTAEDAVDLAFLAVSAANDKRIQVCQTFEGHFNLTFT
ncbi:tonsoku-like protein isoform X2 [Oscarella lobularis]|uniref:tonsoku-like protein isoform X2 n=1 Tax=Oscarella lobularis TaxID=121494 RepID=UPI0033136774